MDLVRLLGLDALHNALRCDDEKLHIQTVRALRLVNRQAHTAALLGVTSYTLTLEKGSRDTNINGAELLRGTKLLRLGVHLCLTGGGIHKLGTCIERPYSEWHIKATTCPQ